jgi:DNA-binding NtrC family response regulator
MPTAEKGDTMGGPAIPAQPPQSSSAGGTTASDLRPKSGAERLSTIMVVEDDILTRLAAADHLRDEGYRVLEAADAEEARTLLRAAEPIEIVISDVNMPGMDGIRLAHWIAKEFPDVKVVLTSGDLTNAAAARLVAHYIEKPYDLDALGRLIKRLL